MVQSMHPFEGKVLALSMVVGLWSILPEQEGPEGVGSIRPSAEAQRRGNASERHSLHSSIQCTSIHKQRGHVRGAARGRW